MAEEDMIMARQGELKRLHVIEKVLEGIVKQVEAAEILWYNWDRLSYSFLKIDRYKPIILKFGGIPKKVGPALKQSARAKRIA